MEFRTFEDLDCWKMCTELRNDISSILKTFPSYERFALTEDLRRASRSVTHNIAEGYGRFHFKENIQSCRMSRGSLYEILDQLITAKDEGYITEDVYLQFRGKTMSCLAILNGYINFLKRQNDNTDKSK
jgi:four helix bundle protein